MRVVDVRSGLRKLEFTPPLVEGEAAYVLVEFVRNTPFPESESARVSLGKRDGVVRELVGVPELLNNASGREYHYRLHGPIISEKAS